MKKLLLNTMSSCTLKAMEAKEVDQRTNYIGWEEVEGNG